MTYSLSEYRIAEMGEAELGRIVDAVNTLSREAEPRAVDLSVDEFRMFAGSPGMTHHRYVAHDADGDVAALGGGRYPDDGTNAELLLTTLRVLPGHRRRGVGTMILARLIELGDELGRTRMQGFFHDTVPAGGEFARAVGATENLDFHQNVVRIDEIDRSLMNAWAVIGDEKAPGYTVQLYEGALPESLYEDVAHLYHVLERDMPMSEDFEPREWSAEQVGEMQDHYLKGTDSLVAVAVRDVTGQVVGMSQLLRRKSDPTNWIVTVTMVDPEHRGRSLGKWVKGVVNVAAFDSWEGGIYEETGNAFTNEPMLAINHAMGFRHEFTITDCSVGLEQARRFVESKTDRN